MRTLLFQANDTAAYAGNPERGSAVDSAYGVVAAQLAEVTLPARHHVVQVQFYSEQRAGSAM
jgi:hypothetical protein